MKTFIYSLTDPRDMIIKYIGKSNNPKKRYYQHFADVRKQYKTKKCNWIRKLISLGFKPILNIIEECDITQWEIRERYWISKLLPKNNQRDGGGGSSINPKEDKSKIIIQYDLDGNFIKEYPSINEAARSTGLELSNISNVCNGKLNKTGNFVFVFKYNNKRKVTNKRLREEKREVLQIDKSGNIINLFESISEAVKKTNIPRTSISNCCFLNENEIEKYKSAYGFIWKFKNKVKFLKI